MCLNEHELKLLFNVNTELYQTSCDLSYSCKPILLSYPVHQFGDPGVDPKGAWDCASIPPRCDSHLKKVL